MSASWNNQLDEIAEAEAWLSAMPTPAPSAAAIAAAKLAMREASARRPTVIQRRGAARGALAAAACLALCATLTWRVASNSRSPQANELLAGFSWSEDTEQQIKDLRGIDDSLSDLEEQSQANAQSDDGRDLYQAFQDAVESSSPAGSSSSVTPNGLHHLNEDTI